MRHPKAIFLGMLAATALVVAVAPGSAAAEATLCSTNTNPCTGTTYGSGTKFTASLKAGTHANFVTTTGTITCKKSTLAMTTSNNRAHGSTTAATYTECTLGGNACTVTAVNLPWTSEWVTNLIGGNGRWVNTPVSGSGKPTVSAVCSFLLNCSFSASEWSLEVTGGNPAIAVMKELELSRSGGICPAQAKASGEWEITSPKPLFVEP